MASASRAFFIGARGPASIGVALLLAVPLLAGGCGHELGDSSAPGFATPQERVEWMSVRLVGKPPSTMSDAHFRDLAQRMPHGHMGPAYSMYWFHARIEIDPKDAPAWIARTRTAPPPPGWRRDLNPMSSASAAWAMSAAEFDAAAWYDPAPLVGSSTHRGYQGGHMAITNGGATILIWQHWR